MSENNHPSRTDGNALSPSRRRPPPLHPPPPPPQSLPSSATRPTHPPPPPPPPQHMPQQQLSQLPHHFHPQISQQQPQLHLQIPPQHQQRALPIIPRRPLPRHSALSLRRQQALPKIPQDEQIPQPSLQNQRPTNTYSIISNSSSRYSTASSVFSTSRSSRASTMSSMSTFSAPRSRDSSPSYKCESEGLRSPPAAAASVISETSSYQLFPQSASTLHSSRIPTIPMSSTPITSATVHGPLADGPDALSDPIHLPRSFLMPPATSNSLPPPPPVHAQRPSSHIHPNPLSSPPPQSSPQPPKRELNTQFRRMLSTKRMNRLSRTSSMASLPQDSYADQFLDPAPPSYNSLRNIPVIPIPATDSKSRRFREYLVKLSQNPVSWENPGLLDEALSRIPLDLIYRQAEENTNIYLAEAASLGPNVRPKWGHQDYVVKALLSWFKNIFFTWVGAPPCTTCNSPTDLAGLAAPLEDELVLGASTVEFYKCSVPDCAARGGNARFPRFFDAFVLMNTRRGRVGEWVACFGMLCRAISARVRWVWNQEDYVWIEYYSQHQRRWVHIDPVEGQFDQPRGYARGWKRKLSYCIAFSRDGATDVTRRYVRDFNTESSPRSKCPEPVLLSILDEIKATRRKDMTKQERFVLQGEDIREEKELVGFVMESLVHQLCKSLEPGYSNKAAEANANIATVSSSSYSNSTRDSQR